MELRWINEQKTSARSVALGTFDGVHLGHQKLLETAVACRPAGGTSAVFTFDYPPEQFFRGQFRLLSAFESKVQLIQSCGIEEVAWLPFGQEIAELDAEEFVRHLIMAELKAVHVICGFNYRFGRGRAGDVEFLQEQGRRYGFNVTVVPSVHGRSGELISSTLIRSLLAEGQIQEAAECLGRFPAYRGVVVPGQGRGRQLGFPTANLEIDPRLVLPRDGVYLTWCLLPDGKGFPAVTSIGRNPTFAGQVQTVEVYLLDFDGNLYGEILELQFLERMREIICYPTPDALSAQIDQDVEQARKLLWHYHLQDARVVLK